MRTAEQIARQLVDEWRTDGGLTCAAIDLIFESRWIDNSDDPVAECREIISDVSFSPHLQNVAEDWLNQFGLTN